jgi:hypothetical protein
LVPCIKKESFIGGLKLDGGKKNKLETWEKPTGLC